MCEWQWHQLDQMQVCTSLQTDDHATTLPLTGHLPFLSPNQQRQSSEGYATMVVMMMMMMMMIMIIIVILRVLTSSSQLPLKLPGHGTRWLLNWFKRLADGSHLSSRTAEKQYFCSSACPLPFNREMRSPPQHVHCHRLITHCSHFLLNFQLPTGFVLVG